MDVMAIENTNRIMVRLSDGCEYYIWEGNNDLHVQKNPQCGYIKIEEYRK